MTPFAPSDVDCDGQQQHEANHHRRRAAFESKPDEPVRQQRDDDCAHQRLADRASTAADAVAAKQRGRDRGEFEAEAGVRAGAGKPRCIKHAAETRQHARDDIGQADGGPHRDAGVVGRAPRSADRDDAPADAQPSKNDMRDDRHDSQNHEADRRAQDRSRADKIPGVGIHVARSDPHGIVLKQKLDYRAYERQHDERGQERAQPEKPDQEAVDQPDQGADGHRRCDRRLHRPFRDIDQRQRGQIGERE